MIINNVNYKNKMLINEEISNYLRKLFFELQGYRNLLREFMTDSLDCDLQINEEYFNKIIQLEQKLYCEVNLAIEEITGTQDIDNFFVDFVKKEVYWNNVL